MFIFTLLAWAIAFGFAVSIFFVVIPGIYSLPYAAWCGWVDADSKYPETRGAGFYRDVRNATRLYIHWIFKTELKF